MTATDLRRAAGRDQIRLALAPLVRPSPRAVAGFVAHACWDHPDAGPIEPDRLRPLAVRLGLARELDTWTAERVAAALDAWSADARDALALLALVVDPATLGDPSVHRYLGAVADLSGLAPDRLRLVSTPAELQALLRRRRLRTTTARSVSTATAGAMLEGVPHGASHVWSPLRMRAA